MYIMYLYDLLTLYMMCIWCYILTFSIIFSINYKKHRKVYV